jgi:serine/threonine-protein kinase
VEPSPESLSRLTRFLGHRFPLGQLAILNHHLSPADLGLCLEEQSRSEPRRRLGAILLDRRHLTAEQLSGLLEQQQQLQELDARGGLPATLEGVLRIVGRYVLAEQAGRGGAGVVWKSWDTQLRRWVAFKESRLEGEDARRRFLREARAAARLSHPNVVTVHDSGETDGKAYVVMEFVEGLPLDEFLRAGGRDLRGLVTLVAKVADGVHHAHEHGIVHRDLKPQNVLVSGSGEPKVADFGLAHGVDSDTLLTRTGGAAGTPRYMAPEQVDRRGGGEATPRTDVYALGAILYEALTGRPPHDGDSVTQIFAGIVSREPLAPRTIDPRLPRELETVALKALEKDPPRRYATAKAFAEELRRFLDGEPVLARPAGPAERLSRRVRKSPVPFALGAGLLAVLAGMGVLWTGREAERERGLRSVREMARVSLNAALEFRRVGANPKMRQYLPPLESAYREAVERAPDLAEPEYLMGRLHRALLDDERALEFQNRALAKDPRYAPALYERAVLTSQKYGREQARTSESLRTLGSAPVTVASAQKARPPTLEQIESARPDLARLRESVLRDCTALEAVLRAAGNSSVTEAHALAARGILAYHRRDDAEARRTLREAVLKNPALEEAWETLALAVLRQPAPGNAEKDRVWKDAERTYTEGLSRDRGYLPLLKGRGQVRTRIGNNLWDSGGDPIPAYAAAEEDYAEAIRIAPDDASLWLERARVRDLRGQYRDDRGGDPFPDLADAEADFTKALEARPGFGEALSARAAMRSWRGLFRMNRGEDPGGDFAAAEADLAEALASPSDAARARVGLARVRTRRAICRIGRGEDPRNDLAEAETNLTEALRLSPGSPSAWVQRGQASTWRAIHRSRSGEDPSADFAAAEEAFAEALRLDPEELYALEYRSHLWTERGVARAKRGEDPLPDFAKAEESLAEMLRLYQGYSVPWAQWGRARAARASFLESRGDRAGAARDYAAAASDFERALRLNPGLSRELGEPLRTAREKASALK